MYIRKSSRLYKGKTYTNYVLVESVLTPKGPRQKTICSLGDLSPRRREEWLKLARKIEDALVGQSDLLDGDEGEVADIVGRVRARRTSDARANADPAPPSSPPRRSGGALIKVDPSRVTTAPPLRRRSLCVSAACSISIKRSISTTSPRLTSRASAPAMPKPNAAIRAITDPTANSSWSASCSIATALRSPTRSSPATRKIAPRLRPCSIASASASTSRKARPS